MNIYAVFGNPILHSKSPQMMNNAFKDIGANNFYTRIWARTGEEVIEIIRSLNIAGANITSPFKETVIPHLDKLSDDAKNIEAVNTITYDNGILTGYNTDPFGVIGAINEAGINLRGKKSLVFGAGGAGKAAAYGLIKAGSVTAITNRTFSKAKDIADKFNCNCITFQDAVKSINNYDVIVMALLPGVWPIDNNNLKNGMVILNSVYSGKKNHNQKEQTKYILIDGLRWLLHHAAECFSYFAGAKANINALEKGIKQDLNPEKIKTESINENVFDHLSKKEVDLLLPVNGLNKKEIEKIIKNEMNHAFGL